MSTSPLGPTGLYHGTDDREVIGYHRRTGTMVPIVEGGSFIGMVWHRTIDRYPLPAPLPPADFIVGLEALGFAFSVHEIQPGEVLLLRQEPTPPLPDAWERRALDIMAAYGAGRGQEAVAFLRDRDASGAGALPYAKRTKTT